MRIGDQGRRVLHGARHALERLAPVAHQRIVLMGVDEGAPKVEKAHLALVVQAQQHRLGFERVLRFYRAQTEGSVNAREYC